MIKGLHKLNGLEGLSISKDSMAQLASEALVYKNNWNLAFEIIGAMDNFVLIKATQGKHPDKKYLDKVDIINETKKMFGKYITNAQIHVRATINIPSPPSIVDSEWVTETMYDAGIFLTDIQSATGIDEDTLNEWISGKIPMTQAVKAMFYYYMLHMMNVQNNKREDL